MKAPPGEDPSPGGAECLYSRIQIRACKPGGFQTLALHILFTCPSFFFLPREGPFTRWGPVFVQPDSNPSVQARWFPNTGLAHGSQSLLLSFLFLPSKAHARIQIRPCPSPSPTGRIQIRTKTASSNGMCSKICLMQQHAPYKGRTKPQAVTSPPQTGSTLEATGPAIVKTFESHTVEAARGWQGGWGMPFELFRGKVLAGRFCRPGLQRKGFNAWQPAAAAIPHSLNPAARSQTRHTEAPQAPPFFEALLPPCIITILITF